MQKNKIGIIAAAIIFTVAFVIIAGNSPNSVNKKKETPYAYYPKRYETFSGTTNASGQFTATFVNTYAVAPNAHVEIVGGSDNQFVGIASVSTTACVIQARQRTDIAGLLPSFSNLSGASVLVTIVQK